MKTKLLFLVSVCAILASTACAKDKNYQQRLMETVEKDRPTLKDLGKPALTNPDASMLILMGDTQTYTPKMCNRPVLEMMTAWIAYNIDTLNIKGLLHTGDIVEYNNQVDHGSVFDQNSKQQWEWVSHCFKRLDNKIPCILTTGNHDYSHNWFSGEESRYTSQFSTYFDPSRNYKTQKAIYRVFTEKHKPQKLDNVIYKIDMGGQWGEIYVMSLELYPRQEVIEWALKRLESKRMQGKTVILLTHSYLAPNGKLPKDGQILWEGLVKKAPQIRLVLSGHYAEFYGSFQGHSAVRTDVNDFGKNVHSILFDPQCTYGGWNGSGGDGWLRLLEFQPDGKTIKVRTYSVLFGHSPMTKHYAWRTAPYDMFDLTID